MFVAYKNNNPPSCSSSCPWHYRAVSFQNMFITS